MSSSRRLALLGGLAALGCFPAAADKLPRPAPPLTVQTVLGQTITLEGWRGKVVLLKFFSHDCPHCQRSAGNIMPIYREWRSRGLEVLGVEFNPDSARFIPEFARRFGVTYALAPGTRAMVTTFAQVPADFRFYVPYIFLIDRRGRIRFQHPGDEKAFYDNEVANLRAELETLLKEPAPPVKAKGARKAAAQD